MISWMTLALASQLTSAEQQCLLLALEEAQSTTTVAELKALCRGELASRSETNELSAQEPDPEVRAELQEQDNPILARYQQERLGERSDFSLTAHHNNYVLPYTYNDSPNQAPFDPEQLPVQRNEIKFQFSFKLPLTVPLWDDTGRLYFAYTNRSWWQAYNSDHSAPFRETNHEPEIFWAQKLGWHWGEWYMPAATIGLNHQSNGQNGDRSRSWNRLVGSVVWTNDPWTIGLRAWHRFAEDPKESPTDSKGDDNPDISEYLGHSELGIIYKHQEHTFMAKLRNNLDIDDNRGAVELGWTFPIGYKVKGYVQYFYGYGESLIDYNVKTNRIGIGLEMTPYL
ncbi:phospholipase A [Ferrimonas aestuarii]|uniref:Phospholipase A1 n=1 Tax=Ferrimonas aestuarii TaxID=2569539 RepID=A0A4U1BLZ9_9GAMM|nr:phospholipase A [Ferrimonas aestuarii]TKB53986.1 phospholipase [Ferrimonas aestuarii]